MFLTKQFKLSATLFLIIFLFATGCKKTDELSDVIEEPMGSVEDTTNVHEDAVLDPDVTDIKKSKTEIETRLEKLLTHIETKEKALFEREKRALDLEMELGLRAEELNNQEGRLIIQQYIAWIVFVLGLIAIVVAIVINRIGQRQSYKFKEKAMKKKEEYLAKLDNQLNRWEAAIEELTLKAGKAKEDVKQEYLKQIDTLNEKKEDAKKKLQDLKAAKEELWTDSKKIVEKSWADMRKSIKQVSSRIK